MTEDFVAGFASGRAGKVGAGAGERGAQFRNKIIDDFVFGPTESDTTSVGGDFQGEAVRSVNDDGKWARPTSLGETIKIVGKIFGKNLGIDERVNEDGKGALFGASLDTKNFFNRGEIDGIGGESVERVRGDSNDGTAIKPTCSVADDPRIGTLRSDLQHFSGQ